MKASTKIITITVSVAVVAAVAFGGLQVANAFRTLAAPGRFHLSLAPLTAATPVSSPTAPATPAVPVDPAALAQQDSGLTPARYAELKAEVTAAVSVPVLTPAKKVAATIATISTKYGKPVVVVDHYKCYGSGIGWGITGALSGSSAGSCGLGDSANESAILTEMYRRAGVEGWTSSDYILVITTTV
jgi:hypothetical protein